MIKNLPHTPAVRTWLDGTGLSPDEILVDSFAGGGGASTGKLWATGREPDIAINHDAEAIAMHKANHPSTKHYIEDVWQVDPVEACAGRPVGLAWFSPTCTDFSKAKGTALNEASIKLRGLCWVAVRWAAAVQPRIICLENVEEFQKSGPLHRRHSEGCPGERCLAECRFGKKCKGRAAKVRQHLEGCPGRACATGCWIYKPIKERVGETFKLFVRRLEKLGYVVEWRLMRACDYGAPTTRRRLFLVARRDGRPIVWPAPTHAPAEKAASLGLLPYRSASECIDWSDLGKSIFDEHGNTRHADKTLARLAAGVQKFVIDSAKPFIVPMAYGTRGGKLDGRVNDIDDPMPVICGNRGGHAVVSAMVVPYSIHRSNGERGPKDGKPGQAPRIYDVSKPMGTIVAQGQKHAACAALLIKHNGGNNDRCGSPGQGVEEPVHTISTRDTKALTAVHLVRYNGQRREGEVRGTVPDEPLSTLDTSNRHAMVAAHLVKMRGTSDAHIAASAHSVEQPMPTISASGTHMATVAAFLVRYNGQSKAQDVSGPIGTLDTTDRYALATVMIDGETWVIADIFMRMLHPDELATAQGFPENYVLNPMFNGKPLTKTAQVRMIGNSVSPYPAKALVQAQFAA